MMQGGPRMRRAHSWRSWREREADVHTTVAEALGTLDTNAEALGRVGPLANGENEEQEGPRARLQLRVESKPQ